MEGEPTKRQQRKRGCPSGRCRWFAAFADLVISARMSAVMNKSVRTMTPALDETLQTIMAHLDRWLEPPPEPGVTMSHEAVLESLQWLSAANFGGAVHLTRLRNAGVELKREDGKDLDRWIVEQVRMANLASSARTEYSERNGLAGVE